MGLIFLLSMLFPPLGLLFPMIKVRRYEKLPYLGHLLLNFIALLLIGGFDYSLGIIYFGFLLVEIIYYLCEKHSTKLEVFDRINITALINSLFIFVAIYLVISSGAVNEESIKSIYVERGGMDLSDVDRAFQVIKDNRYSFIFGYAYIQSLILYVVKKKGELRRWKVSYLWVLIYVAAFVYKYFTKENGVLISNIMEIGRGIFYIFGIKEFLNISEAKLKSRFLAQILTVFLFSILPISMFIYGGMVSFKDEE